MAGRRPIPSGMKIIRGTDQPCRMNKREPKPRSDRDPYCPDHLDETAKTEWNRLLPILKDMRILTEADYIALANLCQQYSILIKAHKQLSASGLLFKTATGYVMQSPLISIITGTTQHVNTLCREFGLTPSARAKVQTIGDEKQEADPWAAIS